MAEITQTISTIPEAGHRGIDSRDDFVTKQEAYQDHQRDTLVGELNNFGAQANSLRTEVNTSRDDAVSAKDEAVAAKNVALAGANYKGDWVAGYNTTGYNLNESVTYTDGYAYRSKINDNLVEPTSKTNTSEWDFVEAVSPEDLALKLNATNPSITGSITEEVSVCTLALEPDNGTVQTYTATGDATFTDGLADGQFLTLILTNGGNTITFPTLTWWNAEPTLGTTDKIFFEKIGSTLYATQVGTIV